MAQLRHCPSELLDLIIEYLILRIGIAKAVRLRNVGRAFNVAILDAIIVRQVVDSLDPATPSLWWLMSSDLRAKIAVVKSCSTEVARTDGLFAIARVNQMLDKLTSETDENLLRKRHEAVAEVVNPCCSGYGSPDKTYDAKLEAQNILSGAIIIGNMPVVKSLLTGSQDVPTPLVNVNGTTSYFGRPLVLAAGCGHIQVVRYLLNHGARPDIISGYSLHETEIDRENSDWEPALDTALLLASSGNRHPATAPSALRAAVLGGYIDIVRLLLLPEYRLSPSKMEYLAAIVAAARVSVDLIQMLVQAGERSFLDICGLGQEMIWEAIRYDRKDVVQMLLDTGAADVNQLAESYHSRITCSLQYAASLGNIGMIRFLLERGANIHLPEFAGGHSPVEGAAISGHEEAVEILLEHGANPDEALRGAARGGEPRVVKWLLDRFPDLLHQENGDVGRRALFYAVGCRNLTSLTILVKHGAALNDGYAYPSELPINLAKDGFGSWVVRHLLSLGAEDTDTETLQEREFTGMGFIRTSERTWEWLGKY
ncbi:F-box domain and ankyrin repeat protein [Pochonia chlamydosporia 170]|uniref:F-box domain and ankyrin repeat protein n=1 Tax=Pochonia chlamydosporia 170 TaxID=1380566 RepID=A0A179F168_METCM|nr:F-box domain and ankyrin repeat protein [Pochonia chlamydosporia 170]OAQ59215.1 F-box domain and ankyrin repeat protein [Pochonia chlamydosporia 170]